MKNKPIKHFVKKFKFEADVNDVNALKEAVTVEDTANISEINLKYIKINNGKLRVNIENTVHIDAFPQYFKKELYLMPLPDITLVFLDQAYYINRNLKNLELEENLTTALKKLSDTFYLDETILGNIYTYIGFKTTIITNLFTALESFFNQYIDEHMNENFKIKGKESVIGYGLCFDQKIKYAIPYLTNKKYKLDNNVIIQLAYLRDEIIHIKYGKKGLINSQLMDKIINFDFDKNYCEIVSYFNFHKENYVRECPCSNPY